MASMEPGSGRCDGECVSTNGIASPSLTENSATVERFSPRIGAGVRKVVMSGPAMARSTQSGMSHGPSAGTPVASETRLTHGTEAP